MPVVAFPDPRDTDEDGIVAWGGDLHPTSLLLAYRQGIFPWPIEGMPLAWFCPPKRAVLEYKKLHIPRSLDKFRRKSPYRISRDKNFEGVIQSCSERGKEGTWITEELKSAYLEFHRHGYAHSIEVWDQTELVGGLYGVLVDGIFSAESMFYRRPNASKLALLDLIEHLHLQGLDWIDIQVMTPHMKALGATLISRDRFLERLEKKLPVTF